MDDEFVLHGCNAYACLFVCWILGGIANAYAVANADRNTARKESQTGGLGFESVHLRGTEGLMKDTIEFHYGNLEL